MKCSLLKLERIVTHLRVGFRRSSMDEKQVKMYLWSVLSFYFYTVHDLEFFLYIVRHLLLYYYKYIVTTNTYEATQ